MQNLFSVEILASLLGIMSLYLFLKNLKYKNIVDSMNTRLAYNYVNQMFISKLITMVTHNYAKSIGDIMYLVKNSFDFDGVLIYDLSFDIIKLEMSSIDLSSYVRENKKNILSELKNKKITSTEYDERNVYIMQALVAPSNLIIVFSKLRDKNFLPNEEWDVLYQVKDIISMIYRLGYDY